MVNGLKELQGLIRFNSKGDINAYNGNMVINGGGVIGTVLLFGSKTISHLFGCPNKCMSK